tara:strand:- start:762 stop:956 length:195 start_codon:yes stop_codon:yes gene_type:complete
MIKITIEDETEVTGVKRKHSWTLEDAVHDFETVLNTHFGTDVQLSVKPKQNKTVVVPISETEGM